MGAGQPLAPGPRPHSLERTGVSSATPFPGMAALLPTLGAALVIHAGDGGQSLAGRVLGVSSLGARGLISYSLYLWHWPLLVFARTDVGRELSMAEALAALALSVPP